MHIRVEFNTLKELYWTIPSDKVYFKIDLNKNELNICNPNSKNKWDTISKIEQLDGIEKQDKPDYKKNAFSILTYNVLYETFYLPTKIWDHTIKEMLTTI